MKKQLLFEGMLGLDLSAREEVRDKAHPAGFVVANDGYVWHRANYRGPDREVLDQIARTYGLRLVEVRIGTESRNPFYAGLMA